MFLHSATKGMLCSLFASLTGPDPFLLVLHNTGKGLAPRDYSFANTKHNKAHQLYTYRTLFILTSLYTQQ